MLKNYKCNSCGVNFPAEEGPKVVCPHCQSDDTVKEKEGNAMKKIIIIASAAFVAAIGVGLLIGFLTKEQTTDSFAKNTSENNETIIEDSAYDDTDEYEAAEFDDSVLDEAEALEPDFTEIEDVEIDEVLPEAPAEPAKKPNAKQNDMLKELGKNKQQQLPSAPAKAESKKPGKESARMTELPGAKKDQRLQKPAPTKTEKPAAPQSAKPAAPKAEKPAAPAAPLQPKLSTAAVQSLINTVVKTGNANALLGAKGVSKSVKFSYVNTGGETIPGGVSGLKSGIEMLGFSGYTVVGLDFDAQNNVTGITLQPIK